MASKFNEVAFRQRLSRAQDAVRRVLTTTRHPCHPSEVAHVYDDKYQLCEWAIKASMASQLVLLERFGLTDTILKEQCMAWAQANKSVTLRFSSTERCAFLRKASREEESRDKVVQENSWVGKTTTKVVTRIDEWFWDVSVEWELRAFCGTDAGEGVVLLQRTAHHEVTTTTERTPHPECHVEPARNVSMDWLMARLVDGKGKGAEFAIDRDDKHCHTPRRNNDIEGALHFNAALARWCKQVSEYFSQTFSKMQHLSLDLGTANANEILSPVLALFSFEEKGNDKPFVARGDLNAFVSELERGLANKDAELAKAWPSPEAVNTLVSQLEGQLIVAAAKLCGICLEDVPDACNAVEAMLHTQLVSAIGKEVRASDFAEYMEFHNRRFFKPAYCPRAFSYAVRRPDHYPEGLVSIETRTASSTARPLQTMVAYSSDASEPMRISLNASTEISFLGERYVHAAVLHSFLAEGGGTQLQLVASARQFSSFILMVGKIASASVFEPTGAMIIKDKDDFRIPLLLETMPTPKEFRDAIESLSPEQQRFCKAFREMQLASTLFGICIIQIKPQMELLLGLPSDALTKEIELTQDLMDMFIRYQIPSDLMSYSGDLDASASAKVQSVKGHVAALKQMIDKAREAELKEQEELEAKRKMEREMAPRGGIRFKNEGTNFAAMQGGGPPVPAAMAFGAMRSAPREPEMMVKTAGMRNVAPPMPRAPPPPRPTSVSQPHQQQQQHVQQVTATQNMLSSHNERDATSESSTDYTRLPQLLDRKFEEFDEDSALRPTTIKTGGTWTKRSQAGLISDLKTALLREKEQGDEKSRAFDLLDALSRSGVLPCDHAALHVVLAATHCFTDSLVNTVVQGNINPIEKVERSELIMSSAIHNVAAIDLIAPAKVEGARLAASKLLTDQHS